VPYQKGFMGIVIPVSKEVPLFTKSKRLDFYDCASLVFELYISNT
jgi:hypothetical protein